MLSYILMTDYIYTQVKELGVLGVDCECLAMDAQKLFDVYWYLSLPGASIPHRWPVQFSAMFNATNPLQLTIEKTPSQIYWAVSHLQCINPFSSLTSFTSASI